MTKPTYNFTPISPPGITFDTVTGINNLGKIVGYTYSTAKNDLFTYDGGFYTNLSGPSLVNISGGMNDFGHFVGYGEGQAQQFPNGFLYDGSTFQSAASANTQLTGINNSGQIVGNHTLAWSGPGGPGFLDSGGNVTNLEVPLSNGAFAYGINNSGQIVGYYLDSHNLAHAFVDTNGTYTTLDEPLGTDGTYATAINDTGQIFGYYKNASGQHGFLYINGAFTTLDNPLGVNGTSLTGINEYGQIVGNYLDSAGQSHGFLGTLAFSAAIAANTVYTKEYGAPPDAAELNVLIEFTMPQYTFGQQLGVMDPAVYA